MGNKTVIAKWNKNPNYDLLFNLILTSDSNDLKNQLQMAKDDAKHLVNLINDLGVSLLMASVLYGTTIIYKWNIKFYYLKKILKFHRLIKGDIEVVECLLKFGADVHTRDKKGFNQNFFLFKYFILIISEE